MDHYQSVTHVTQPDDHSYWVQPLQPFDNIIATSNEELQVQSIIKLSRLSNRAPVSILLSTVPMRWKLAVTIAFDGPNRVNVVRLGGLKVVIDMLNSDSCPDSLRLLLLDILSALALLREVRRLAVGLLVESCKVRKMVSRVRVGQAIRLLGLVKKARRELVNSVAGNALGVVSSHMNYIRSVAEHGVIPLYAELLQGQKSLGKEIAEDAFCILAFTDENAVAIVEHLVRIMRGNDDESVAAAADVVWDLSSYKHVLPVIHRFGVISLLVELLSTSNDSDVMEKVCGAIGQLSYKEAELVVIADLGGISVLINMLEDESEEIRTYTRWKKRSKVEILLMEVTAEFRVRERMVQTRAAELRLAESVRQMTIDELTWNPPLGIRHPMKSFH
ncbi:hypothetical protein M8C21_001204 [Ambrosia artemisiifolia]|uniref:Uncharacterized protein n=1 Tax=Ambrosia artemisiifolia TaxID=4212 RepID=A0AAD5GHT2_AMBAR|nr:hypothetical protein M8C21_001204 [Ambrosia artemisiifolia]